MSKGAVNIYNCIKFTEVWELLQESFLEKCAIQMEKLGICFSLIFTSNEPDDAPE